MSSFGRNRTCNMDQYSVLPHSKKAWASSIYLIHKADPEIQQVSSKT
jgi:hypothetical protein